MRDQRPLARQIYHLSHLEGEFLLRSGVTSHEYFDKYRFEAEPAVLHAIAAAMRALIPAHTDILAGLEMGGIPVATMLSQASGIPARFVRKQAKEYGTRNLCEGGDVGGKRVVIVEDVVTSGGQILLSARDLRELGAQVTHVLCVIDRQGGGAENLAQAGLQLHPLFTMQQLKEAARQA